jgi:hypothetical protein
MKQLNRRYALNTLLTSLLVTAFSLSASAQEGAPAKIIVGFYWHCR